jgi:lipopolysaccharide/colanic/teichoic acid biosynthesis glycosyltransferase
LRRPAITVLSSVGGGPMVRLVDALRARGREADLAYRFEPSRWRELMAKGRLGRLRARAGAVLRFPVSALRRSLSRRAGILVPTTNPFFVPVLLVATKALHGRPVLPLLYDLYPETLEAAGALDPESLASRLGVAANRFLMRHADGVAFIGERMGAHARHRYGAPRRHATIETGASTRELAGVGSDFTVAGDLGDRVVASYVGNLGHMHDWETLAAGLAKLARSDLDDVAVVIAASGPGVDHLRRELGDTDERIRFIPPLGDRAWRALLARTDVALVTLRDEARSASIPSKVFSAMAAGAAVLAVAPRESDLADVVSQAGCGAVVQPGNSIHFYDALSRMVRDRGYLAQLQQSAAGAARDRYDLDVLAERWEQLADRVARDPRPGVGYDVAKRVFDLTVAGAALVALSPLLAAAAAAIRATMGRPILFRQRRAGLGGRPFELLKLRSMRAPRPGESGPEHDAARLTRLGKLLRATSIDELPALVNVLRGEMSLVGPRPLVARYVDRYSPEQARRHEVLPGITSLAQTRGRNSISWPEKLAADCEYVDNRSLWLDLEILIDTAVIVLKREGISAADHATMPEFTGEQAG